MTLYSFKAKDKDNNPYEGSREAASKIDLYDSIRAEGGRILSVREVKEGASLISMFSGLFGKVKTHEKIVFARNLSSMISAGLSVTRALDVMEKQAKSKRLKDLFHDLSLDVSHGETLSDAMKKKPKIFSRLFTSMVRAGEESGNLSGSLSIVANQMDKSYALAKKVRGALIYPAVILSVMVVLAILMLVYMVPTLTETFKGIGVELPLSTRIIISMSDFLVANTILVVFALILFIFAVMAAFRSAPGRKILDVVSIRIPVIGTIIKEAASARTARSLSSLMSSGVNIIVALEVTADIMQNSLYKKALAETEMAIQKGEPMSVVFSKYENIYPVFVSEMVAVGEETGKISDMLLGVATYYENEVEEKTKDLSTIIEPILMIIIGAAVGVFAISMLAPTYSLVENI